VLEIPARHCYAQALAGEIRNLYVKIHFYIVKS